MRNTKKVLIVWLTMLMAVLGTAKAQAQDYNPDNPPEPMTRYKVTVSAEPAEAGYVSGSGKYYVGQKVNISTSVKNSNYEFLYWMKDGVRTNAPKSFSFTMGDVKVNYVAVYGYNPGNPQEPTTPNTFRLYLETDAEGSCTFNHASGQKLKADQYVTIAAQNITPGYVFQGWSVNGQKVSSAASFNYKMPYNDVTLTAHLVYNPTNPGDPDSNADQQSIDNRKMGDVTGDGMIDVSDYIGVANYIHGDTPSGFSAKTADVNKDNLVDISDYIGIANLILYNNIYGKAGTSYSETRKAYTDVSLVDNVIYVTPQSTPSDTQLQLSLKMKNTAAIRGFQFDLYLPEGFTASKTNTGRIIASLAANRLPQDDEHTLTVSEQPDGALRFLCGSQYDETFTGSDGEIATLTVNVTEDMEAGYYPLMLRYVKLTESKIENYSLMYEIASFITMTRGDETTGITTTNSMDGVGELYTIDGRQVAKPVKKGLYIQNGKKKLIK